MSHEQRACEPQRIDLFLRHHMSRDEQAEFEAHLDGCDDCRHRLEQSVASPEVWNAIRESLHAEHPSSERSQPFAITTDSASRGAGPSFGIDTVLGLLSPTDDGRMLGRLGTYEVVGVIGTGGMGVVLKALDPALNRYVAIKILSPHLGNSGAARQRFSREAQAAAAVVHENVIEIHGVADANGLPYLVMPYVRGPSLQRRLDDEGPLSVVEILRIAKQAAAGLAEAHAQGLVHRDVKPANILLADGVERVKLTDFGLARAADDASLTKTGVIAGTPQFMSPEQARGESVDQRSDLYSLGSVMYTMCTGHPPFRAETSYGILRRITDTEPRPIREINPDIPEWLCAIIAKFMSKQPDDRIEPPHEAAEWLEVCLAHVQQPTAVPLPKFVEQLPDLLTSTDAGGEKPSGSQSYEAKPGSQELLARRVWLLAAVAIIAAVIVAGIVIRIKRDHKPDTILEVAEGSKVSIGADEVKLPVPNLRAPMPRVPAPESAIDEVQGVRENASDWLGLTFEEVGPSRTPGMRGGLRVLAVSDGGLAAAAGIKSRDILVGIDQWKVVNAEHLEYVKSAVSSRNGALSVFVIRGGRTFSGKLGEPHSLAIREQPPAPQRIDVDGTHAHIDRPGAVDAPDETAWSKDRKLSAKLVVCDVWVTETGTGKTLAEFRLETAGESITFSDDAMELGVLTDEGVRYYDVRSGKLLRFAPDATQPVWPSARVKTASPRRTAQADAAPNRPPNRLVRFGRHHPTAESPDGKLMAEVRYKALTIEDAATREERKAIAIGDSGMSVAFSRDGGQLGVLTAGGVEFYDVSSGNLLSTLPREAWPAWLDRNAKDPAAAKRASSGTKYPYLAMNAISKDGKWTASLYHGSVGGAGIHDFIELKDAETVHVINIHEAPGKSIRFSDDGSEIGLLTDEGVRYYDVPSGRLRRFDPDAKRPTWPSR